MENNSVEQEILEEVKNEPKKNIRDTLYGNIDISLKTMDRFITIMLVILGLAIIFGVII